jgi:hypothetical protein
LPFISVNCKEKKNMSTTRDINKIDNAKSRKWTYSLRCFLTSWESNKSRAFAETILVTHHLFHKYS